MSRTPTATPPDATASTSWSEPVTFGSAGMRKLIEAVAAGADRREREDIRPFEAVDLIRAARLGAFRVPTELGGAGGSFRELFATLIDLAEADCNVGHLLRNHYLFVEQQRLNPDVESREIWLRKAAEGDIFNSAAGELVPFAVGSPEWYSFRTTLSDDGDGFRLNGTKYYTTGTLYSDWVSVLATHPERGLVNATVPVSREGVRVVDDWDGIGQRHTASGTTHLENVWVAPDEIFAGWTVIDGAIPPSYFATQCHLWLQAVVAGELRNVTKDAVNLLRTRSRSFSHAPTEDPREDPLLQEVVGEISATAYAAEALVLLAAEALDAASDSVVDCVPDADAIATAQLRAAQVKIHTDGPATAAATKVFDVGGGSATSRGLELDRRWRNIRTVISHNPTAYKSRAVGDHLINDAPFPDNGYF